MRGKLVFNNSITLGLSLLFLLSTFIPQLQLYKINKVDLPSVTVDQDFANYPLLFEKNAGQVGADIDYLNKAGDVTTYFKPTETVFVRSYQDKFQDILTMSLEGANSKPKVFGLEKQSARSNYLIGDNPNNWQTNISNYKKLKYSEVYPGIDLVYYGKNDLLEHDFVVSPGVDPDKITIKFKGALGLGIDSQGNLVVDQKNGKTVFGKPNSYQDSDKIDSKFRLVDDNTVKIAVGSYDQSKALIIDPPVLSYSTYIGGSGSDRAFSTATDNNGNVYVAGDTTSTNYPTASPYQGSNAGGTDMVISKFDSTGSLVYSTYIGGASTDVGESIDVDASGNIYMVGLTYSSNFPTSSPIDGSLSGTNDAVVFKLNSTGSSLIYSTYLGGTGTETGTGIAVDGSGNAYAVGITGSTNFPTASPFQASSGGGNDVFVTKINAAGSALTYSTYLGGNGTDSNAAVEVDSGGNAYVTGLTLSTNFPTSSPYQGSPGGGGDAFVTKLNSSGSALIFSTYLGGSSSESGQGISVDGSGNVYVAGNTSSTNFPTASPFQGSSAGGANDMYITKFNPAGSALVYSTYLGGGGGDTAHDIVTDGSGNAYVIGITTSADFPLVEEFQGSNGGSSDLALVKISSDGSALDFSTYLGGSGAENPAELAISGSTVFFSGYTPSTNFPTANAYQGSYGGGANDLVVGKIIFSPDPESNSETLSDPTPSQINVTYTHLLSGQSTDTIRCMTTRYTDTVGSSSKPTGMNISSANLSSLTTAVPTPASWSVAANNTTGVITITNAGGEAPAGGNDKLVVFDGIQNGSVTSTSYFVEVKTFSDVGCTTQVNSFLPTAFVYADGVIVTGQVNPTLTFTVDDTTCELGVVDASTTGTCTHTMAAGTNGSNGYAISYLPTATLTSGSDTITETGTTGATSSQGSEQFGLNLKDNVTPNIGAEASGGVGTASTNYATADTFSFTPSGAQVAASSTLSDTTTYTVSYIANVANTTEAGNYSTVQTYNIVAGY